jgi:hypothetical protein
VKPIATFPEFLLEPIFFIAVICPSAFLKLKVDLLWLETVLTCGSADVSIFCALNLALES